MTEVRTFSDMLKLAERLENGQEKPKFRIFGIRDVNPVSGAVKKRRVISAPNEAMEEIHKVFARWLSKAIAAEKLQEILRFATGSVAGGSHLNNVRLHRQHRFFYLLDIRSAFPTVDGAKLIKVLCELCPDLASCEAQLKDFLRHYLLMPRGGLYVGGNASNYLYNLYAGRLIDQDLGELCRNCGITYSRYVDDLAFSSDQPITEARRRTIRTILEGVGFEINHAKAKVLDIAKGPVVINGVGIRQGGELFVPGHYLRTLRGLINRAIHNGGVRPGVVQGKMAVFFFIRGDPENPFNWARMNKTEQKLVKLYDKFRKAFRR